MSATISIKLSNASTERSKNLRLAKATLASKTVYAALYESPSVQTSKVTEFPTEIQAQLDASELELQLVLQNVTTSEQLAVLNLDEMKSTSMQQLLEGAVAAAGSETLKLSLQCAKADPSVPKLATILGSDGSTSVSAAPAPAPAPRRTIEQLVAAGSSSRSIRGSKKLKVINKHTGSSKNVRVIPAFASSSSAYDWMHKHDGIRMAKVLDFPTAQQEALDQMTQEIEVTMSGSNGSNQCVYSAKQLRQQTLEQILSRYPSSDETVMSIQVVDAKEEEPTPAPVVPPPKALRARKSDTIGGSMRLKVTNSHTNKSKNVRIMKAAASSASTYDWLHNHEGLQIAKILEFPEEQQTGLDQKSHELQVTVSTTGSENVVSGKQLCSKTLWEIVKGLPDYDSALVAMSIQVVDIKEEESTPIPIVPPTTLRAMKSDTVGGSMRLKVTNSHTNNSKNVRIMKAAASSASTYDWLYSHEGLVTANILEFPEEQQSGLDQNTYELQITVSTKGEEKVVSAKELRSKSLMEIVEGLPAYNTTLIAMSIEVVETKEEAPELGNSTSAPAGTMAAKRQSSSANLGGSLRLKVSNSHTGMSKNVRIMPSTFSATTSGYDWLHGHDGLKIAKVFEFPEHQEAINQKTQEIQATMHADGIDEKVYSAEDLHFKTMPQILDPIFEQLSDPNALIAMSIEVVDVKANEEEDEDGNKQVQEEELSEEAKEAARLKKKEEEAAFWAAEEAKMLAQAEERKKQKEAKLQAALQAENAVRDAAKKQAAEKEAAIKAEEKERLAKREAQKRAALQAEEAARKQAEAERKEQEEEESQVQQRGVQELQSKRQRASIISAQLPGGSPNVFSGESFAPFDDDDDEEEEDHNDVQSTDDELLMSDEDKELAAYESDAILVEEEAQILVSKDDQSLDDELLLMDEHKDLDSMDNHSLDDELLKEEEDEELEARDMAVSIAAMTASNPSDKIDGKDDAEIDDLLAAEEEQALENQIEAEKLERSHRESTAILAVEEIEELMRMEEAKRLEMQQEEGEEEVTGATRGVMDEALLPRDVVPAADVGQESAEDAVNRENVDQMERLLENKESESRRENERMLALERRAAEMEKANAFAPVEESPRDRSVKAESPKKRKGGVEGRLRKAEQDFVADPARKRSADVIPLSVQFNGFLRKLRKAVNYVKVYQAARQESNVARTKMVDDFGSLSATTPLYDLVGKKASLDQIDDIDARKAAQAATAQGIRSYKSIDQLVELQGKVSADEYQEEMIKYVDAWDEAVSTRVNKAMMLHKKLEQDVLHYENKVAKLRSQAHDMEAKGKLLSSKQSARLNRNEMKLNDAWQIHELECSSICNLLEEITLQGWHDLFPLVRSSIEWEVRRMEREIATYGLGLPGLLKTLGSTVNDVPMPETKHPLRKELAEQRNANRDLERQINKLQTALKGSWTTKAEFQKVVQEENIGL